MSDETQRRILARRARFIALSLAGAGCTPGEAAPTPVVALPVVAPADASRAEPATADGGAVDAMALAEAGGSDGGVSAATQLRYDRVRLRFGEARTRIAAIEAEIAKARPVTTPAGKAEWLTLVGELDDAASSLGMTMGIPCPSPARPETDEFMRWTADEGAKVQAVLEAARVKARAKLKDATVSGQARYDALSTENGNTHPKPCLSIACDSW